VIAVEIMCVARRVLSCIVIVHFRHVRERMVGLVEIIPITIMTHWLLHANDRRPLPGHSIHRRSLRMDLQLDLLGPVPEAITMKSRPNVAESKVFRFPWESEVGSAGTKIYGKYSS
jgi:hypothetical protein